MNVFKEFVQLSKISLTDRLLKEVSDYDIYCELTGIEFSIGKSEVSTVRTDDDCPSFSLFIPTKHENLREEELWWRDFRGDSGDVFKFAKLFAKANFNLDLPNRTEIIRFIDNQLSLGLFHNNSEKKVKRRQLDYNKARESKEILFQSRPFTERDLLWWSKIGVDKLLLNEHDIRSIQYLLREDFSIRKKISIYSLAFAFVIYDKVKVYQPEAGHLDKWKNTCPSEYIQGWTQLKGTKDLIITKSFKDLLVFKSFLHIDVIAPQSESGGFTDAQLAYIKAHYRYVYVVYDYDTAGQMGAEKLKVNHNFLVRWVSKEINEETLKVDDKDISDYISNHDIRSGFNHLKKMFPELDADTFREDRVDYFENNLWIKPLLEN